MDSLDLPEMEHDYSDVPDASEGLDEPARTSPAFGAGEDLSDIEMPVLSEMDGSAPVQPVKAEPQKQAPVQASVQTSAQISEMGGVSPMGGISEMGASSNNTSATGSPAANSMTGTASVSGISEMGASSYSIQRSKEKCSACGSRIGRIYSRIGRHCKHRHSEQRRSKLQQCLQQERSGLGSENKRLFCRNRADECRKI